MKMKTLKLIFFVAASILFINGCNNNGNNPYNPPGVQVPPPVNPPVVNPLPEANTEFYNNVVTAFNQDEDDEPLEVADTEDETSNFDSLI